MTRVLIYSSALIALLGATALTLTSIFLPLWLTLDTPLPPSDHLTLSYGMHRACSSLTGTCRPFPSAADCQASPSGAPSHFCELWRSAAFLLWVTAALEIGAVVAFAIVLAGGVQKREWGWKVLVGMLAGVAVAQLGSTAIVAYVLDYDERFFPGWRLGTAWVVATVSWAVVLATAGALGVASCLLPLEGGYELIPSERLR